jgi:uncharacterized repeat protein (TIGR01451 family)
MGQAVVLLLACVCLQAHANQIPTTSAGGTSTDSVVTKTYPSALRYTITVADTAGTVRFESQGALNETGSADSQYYAPSISVAAANSATRMRVQAACTPTANVCSALGTLTLQFSQPVTNPVLHLAGLGENTAGGGIAAARLRLLSPGSASLAAVGALAVNMTVAPASISSNVLHPTGECASSGNSAGCGSVRVNGTVTSLTFAVDLRTSSSLAATWHDSIGMTVSVDEDFGDVPVGFGPPAPSHIVGDLRLGSSMDADSTNTTSTTGMASPNAVPSGGDNNGVNGDGADEDAISSFPALDVATTSYSLTVPIGGASAAGMVCGWIDYDDDAVLTAAERACTSFGAGASSVVLAWNSANGNPPTGLTAGTIYARLRAAYTPAQIQTANGAGRADSGEVEEYRLDVSDRPRITLTKVSHGGVGTFDFSGDNGYTDTAVTTAVAGTPVAGTTRMLAAAGIATRLTEAATPGYRLTAITCTGLGAGGTATPTLPAAGVAGGGSVLLSASAVRSDSNIACTFTNERLPILRVRKALPLGRAQPGDQFSLMILRGNILYGNATTTGSSNTPAEEASYVATPGYTYTLGEFVADDEELAFYSSTYDCTNSRPGGQTPNGSGTSFTVTPVVGDDLTCTFTNRLIATDISVQKTASASTVARGQNVQFTLLVRNSGTIAADGARIADPAVPGLNCITLSCAAAGSAQCPASPTVGDLQTAPGLAIPALPGGSSVSLLLTCTVTATGLAL